MKKLLLSTLAFSFLFTAVAAPKKFKLLSSTANWSNAANWSPAGLPNDGDTVYIPENVQLTLSNDLTLDNIYFDLYGSMILSGNNMKMILENLSTLNIHTSGWIDGSKASQQIVLGSIIFKGNDPVLTGPKIAKAGSGGFVNYTEFVILPVKFTAFTVARSNNNFLIQWTTTEETKAAYYEVQRSNDGASWNRIDMQNAEGNTTNTYAYTDVSGTTNAVYYRIKQVDKDGVCSYTPIRMLTNSMETIPSILAVQHKITVLFPQQAKGKVTIDIIGLNGCIITRQIMADPAGSVQLNTTLRGVFIVRVSNGQNLNAARKIIL